jgi:hypothetical protein
MEEMRTMGRPTIHTASSKMAEIEKMGGGSAGQKKEI